MLPRNHSDRLEIAFDDHRLVAYAGLLLPATLARTSGLAIDGAVWAVFAQAEFLSALSVLRGAYPSTFPLLLVSEAGPRGLGG